MQPTITPETAKKIKRLMWGHVLLTAARLAVLAWITWLTLTADPVRLVVIAAVLVIFRELARGYRELYEHWRGRRCQWG